MALSLIGAVVALLKYALPQPYREKAEKVEKRLYLKKKLREMLKEHRREQKEIKREHEKMDEEKVVSEFEKNFGGSDEE